MPRLGHTQLEPQGPQPTFSPLPEPLPTTSTAVF